VSGTPSGPPEPARRRDPPRAVLPGRLRRRLTWAFLLVAGVSAGVLAAGSYALVSQARLADSLDRAEADARFDLVLARQFVPVDDERAVALLTGVEQSGRHAVLVTGGRSAASNAAFFPSPPRSLRAIAARGEVGFHRLADGGHRLLLVGGRIPGTTDELYLVVVEDAVHDQLADLGAVLAGGWLVVVVLAALIGHLLARRTLEPVGRASAAATALAEGLLDTRLPVRKRWTSRSPDEFGAWAESFNSMAAALESKITALAAAQARERRFTADVVHELRTPVTALLAEAALLTANLDDLPTDARRPAELLVGDVGRLRRLVEELMEIARLDAGAEPVLAEPIEVGPLVAAVLRAGGWADAVEVSAPAGLTVHTDPRRLRRVLANLVGNAVLHGGEGVTVSVAVAGGELRVDVADRGPGIPAEHVPHLFERFYKTDEARSSGTGGSGLGLAIAAENARLLGGELGVRSEVGRGTTLRLWLPASFVAAEVVDGDTPVTQR
jgi:signal transduction histidine kinase